MSNNSIQKHNFDVAKSNIEKFSRNLPSNPSFNRVEVDGGLFGWGDHKVTGAEMNAFIGKVQDKLISVNSTLRSVIGEFKEVYNAFDYLDGEYISGIIGSVESAEEASKQALKAQEDISATVENLQKAVMGLVSLKANVENLSQSLDYLSKTVSTYDNIFQKLNYHYNIDQLPTIIKKTEDLKGDVELLYNALSEMELKNKQCEKRIKVAYIIGGSAVGLSLVDLILQIVGIL